MLWFLRHGETPGEPDELIDPHLATISSITPSTMSEVSSDSVELMWTIILLYFCNTISSDRDRFQSTVVTIEPKRDRSQLQPTSTDTIPSRGSLRVDSPGRAFGTIALSKIDGERTEAQKEDRELE